MSFTCPDCTATSHHPMDELHRYCVRCGEFKEDKAVWRAQLIKSIEWALGTEDPDTALRGTINGLLYAGISRHELIGELSKTVVFLRMAMQNVEPVLAVMQALREVDAPQDSDTPSSDHAS